MKVLTFEDRPTLNFYFEDYFKEEKHDVTTCSTCGAVYDEFDNNNHFDCYVIDLNAPLKGLPENLHDKTENGLFTGWQILFNLILVNDPDAIKKTIIISEYIIQLEKYVTSEKTSEEEKKAFSKLREYGYVISKSDGFPAFIKAVESLIQRNEVH